MGRFSVIFFSYRSVGHLTGPPLINTDPGEGESHELYSIWEFYEIHETLPRKILNYGKWSSVKGLTLPKENKWIRRRNLEVLKLQGNDTWA